MPDYLTNILTHIVAPLAVMCAGAWLGLRYADRNVERRVDRALTSPKYAAATDDPYALRPLPETTVQKMNRIRAQIAANEARRVDDEWAQVAGEWSK